VSLGQMESKEGEWGELLRWVGSKINRQWRGQSRGTLFGRGFVDQQCRGAGWPNSRVKTKLVVLKGQLKQASRTTHSEGGGSARKGSDKKKIGVTSRIVYPDCGTKRLRRDRVRDQNEA